MRPTATVLCVLMALALPAARPQSQPDQPIRAESTLMEVEVQVLDRKGRPIEGLTAADFQLFENGEPQQIRVFEYIDVPRATAAGRARAPAPPPNPSANPAATDPADADGSEPLRIFISTQIGEAERPRTRAAIKKFIEKEMPAGALVSLNGSPFLSDPDVLLKLVDLDPLTDAMTGTPANDRRFQMVVEPPPSENLSNDDLLRGRRFAGDRDSTDELFDQLGRAQLTRYVDMIRALRMYPGKKMIVLFARGYSLGFDNFKEVFINVGNTDLLDRLRAESVRARVSLYVVDARGLQSSHNGTAEDSEGQRPETLYSRRQADNGVPSFLNSRSPITGGLDDSFRQQQDGLRTIAELTGGVAVVNSNDLGEIFDKVKEDLGGYYLLGYYLPERDNPKQARSLRVETQVDAKLRYRREFYDDAEFSAFLEQEYRDRLTEALGPIPGETSKNAPAPALEAYGAAYQQLGSPAPNFAQAAGKLEQAVRLDEDFAGAWTLLGYARERLGQPGAAASAYHAAVEAEPGYLRPRAHLARLALGRQDWPGAVEHATTLLDAHPADAEAAYYLTVARYSGGELDAAARAAAIVVEAGAASKFPKVRQLLGLVQAARGDFEAATASFQAYLDGNADAPDAEFIGRQVRYWRTAPDLQALRGFVDEEDWPAALELSRKVVEVDSELAEARYYEVLSAFRLNEYDEALESGRALLESAAGREFPQLDRMLGAIYEQRGEPELAAGHYRSFLTAQPDSPDADELKRRLNHWEKAKAYESQSEAAGLRIVNLFGSLTVRSVPRVALAVKPSSATRELVNGDVVAIQEGSSTTIECRPADGARIDLEVTVPYGQILEIQTDQHPVALEGLFYDARVRTTSGEIRLSAPWRATRLDLRAEATPARVSLAPGELLQADEAPDGWTLQTRHETLTKTYGAIRVRAGATASVTVADQNIPGDSPVKMPWQAPAVVQALLEGTAATTTRLPQTEAAPAATGATFTADVRRVSLSAAVAGADGSAILDLTADDFEVLENGRPQEIESLSAGTAPFNLALLLDFSGSTVADRAAIKLAARRLIATARPIDRVALYTLGDEMFAVASELTSDYRRLVDAVETIPALSGGSPLYDAVALAWAQELRQKPGERNALVALTDGVDNRLAVEQYQSIQPRKRRRGREAPPVQAPPGLIAAQSNLEFDQLLAGAARMDTLIYPFLLHASGPESAFPGDVGRRAEEQMRALAAASGGRLMIAESIDDAEPFHDLVRDLRSVYMISYRPENQDLDGQWRTIEVRAKDPSLRIRTRPGYFAR